MTSVTKVEKLNQLEQFESHFFDSFKDESNAKNFAQFNEKLINAYEMKHPVMINLT